MIDLFHFDIETCGEYPDFETFKESDPKGSELFESKYQKMGWEEKYGSVDKAYLENAGIVSTYGKICCISFGYLNTGKDGQLGENGEKRISSYYGDNEKDIVNSFNELLKKIQKKNFNLCGYRILYFDIPWLLHKLHKYGIKPADIIITNGKKPWDLRLVDLYDDWKGRFAWSFSFDEMCYELGVQSPKDKMNGSDVHIYYHNGRLEDVKEYCEKDVASSIDASVILYT